MERYAAERFVDCRNAMSVSETEPVESSLGSQVLGAVREREREKRWQGLQREFALVGAEPQYRNKYSRRTWM